MRPPSASVADTAAALMSPDGVVENDASEHDDPGARPGCHRAPRCRLAVALEHAAGESGRGEHANDLAVVGEPG